MSDVIVSFRQHLACLSPITDRRCNTCNTCNRQVADDEVVVREAEDGWRHIPCGSLLIERDGRPYCERWGCNYFPDPVELTDFGPLAA